MKKHALLSIVLFNVLLTTSFADYAKELWDDPIKKNNNWSYYDSDAVAPFDVDMNWQSSGGVGGSGYVSAPLNALDSAHDASAFWPAYLYRGLGDDQEIDLSIDNAAVKIYARDDTGPLAPVGSMDLQGGSVHLFIGQWFKGVDPGPQDDTWSFFYNTTALNIIGDVWTESTISVGDNSNWDIITRTNNSISPDDLFHHPEQWGFVVFPAAGDPSGVLGLDSFRVVPEPTTVMLLGFGILFLKRRSRV